VDLEDFKDKEQSPEDWMDSVTSGNTNGSTLPEEFTKDQDFVDLEDFKDKKQSPEDWMDSVTSGNTNGSTLPEEFTKDQDFMGEVDFNGKGHLPEDWLDSVIPGNTTSSSSSSSVVSMPSTLDYDSKPDDNEVAPPTAAPVPRIKYPHFSAPPIHSKYSKHHNNNDSSSPPPTLSPTSYWDSTQKQQSEFTPKTLSPTPFKQKYYSEPSPTTPPKSYYDKKQTNSATSSPTAEATSFNYKKYYTTTAPTAPNDKYYTTAPTPKATRPSEDYYYYVPKITPSPSPKDTMEPTRTKITRYPTRTPRTSSPTTAPTNPPTTSLPTKAQNKLNDVKDFVNKEEVEVTRIVKDPTAEVMAGLLGAIAIFGMLCTAWQLLENPDGVCSSCCRLYVKFWKCLLKVICLPCRLCCFARKGYSDANNPVNNAIFLESEEYTNDLELT